MALSLFPSHLTPEHLEEAYPEHWDIELQQTVRFWLKDLQNGMRPLTLRTIQTTRERFFRYTLTLKTAYGYDPLSLAACLDLKIVYGVISSFPIESYSNRHNTFYAIFSLVRLTGTHVRYHPELEFQNISTIEWPQTKNTLQNSSSRSKKRCIKAV